MVDTTEDKLEEFKDKFKEIKKQMSDVRKKGKNTKFAEIKSMNFLSKIKLAGVTGEDKDIEVARLVLDSVNVEIEPLVQEVGFESAKVLITQAHTSIKDKNVDQASRLYREITRIYHNLQKNYTRQT